MNPRIDDWSGQRVWVIGASTGIGKACAHLLVDLGARVAFSARSIDKLLATTAQ
ncbi:SDR family NAD(P)-dependent oxidoreductase [Massilia sp. H-1]|nr:SDR family NAD(P)-dependent oxidoreductase [Massilia sp. H-1]